VKELCLLSLVFPRRLGFFFCVQLACPIPPQRAAPNFWTRGTELWSRFPRPFLSRMHRSLGAPLARGPNRDVLAPPTLFFCTRPYILFGFFFRTSRCIQRFAVPDDPSKIALAPSITANLCPDFFWVTKTIPLVLLWRCQTSPTKSNRRVPGRGKDPLAPAESSSAGWMNRSNTPTLTLSTNLLEGWNRTLPKSPDKRQTAKRGRSRELNNPMFCRGRRPARCNNARGQGKGLIAGKPHAEQECNRSFSNCVYKNLYCQRQSAHFT